MEVTFYILRPRSLVNCNSGSHIQMQHYNNINSLPSNIMHVNENRTYFLRSTTLMNILNTRYYAQKCNKNRQQFVIKSPEKKRILKCVIQCYMTQERIILFHDIDSLISRVSTWFPLLCSSVHPKERLFTRAKLRNNSRIVTNKRHVKPQKKKVFRTHVSTCSHVVLN